MSWQFHPKPQSDIVTLRQTIKDLPECDQIPEIDHVWIDEVERQTKWIGRAANLKPGESLVPGVASSIRVHWDKPLPTIQKNAMPGRPPYVRNSSIHPSQPRALSIRELARCQSFPDNFRFVEALNNGMQRIGNSVPPNLMKAIALNLKQSPMLKDTEKPTVISTFAGCGGSSLGYHLAGFQELLAVEWEDNAAATFKLNFPDVSLFHGDIAKLSVEECMSLAGLTEAGHLDVFDGSPPCQGFSTAGNRKFSDPRNSLFKEYARLLRGLQPKCFVMENVTGMIKGYMKQAYLQIVADLRECGYVVKGQVMNAKYYNVPQSRERVIIIGIRADLSKMYDCSS